MCCLKEDAKPTMVCTADDLLDWKDFPKGLKVLLIDADGVSEMRSRLEGMDYTVSAFGNEDEALSAISSKSECFHVAIVAVNTENSDGILKFLDAAKDLPTLMMSNNHCLSTMMKCIALGAVEFLQKPVPDDKLRNLWQHYVHKAFNAGGKDISAAMKPVKESLVSMLHLRLENSKEREHESVKQERFSPVMEQNQDKYPAPSTPDHEGCQDLANLSVDRDSVEMNGECKSVETTCGISLSECSAFSSPEAPEEVAAIKDEHESIGAGEQNANKDQDQDQDQDQDLPSNAAEPIKPSPANESCGVKASRRKSKVDWTSDLHKKFVQAVEQLGVDQAIPSRILELMKVEGLTRHNVASHLQKYRMHRKHMLPKEPERRWPHPGDPVQRSFYPAHKPVMAFPSYHANHNLPVHPPWMNPNAYSGAIHSWASPYYPGWQVPTEAWHWQTYPGMHAEAWGCPVMPPPPVGSIPQFPQIAPEFPSPKEMQNAGDMLWNSCDLQPADEVVDMVVKEAISKPWLPLPLGLKPPSTESVLTELSKQGISRIPPQQPSLQF